jgi:hypothetical protein
VPNVGVPRKFWGTQQEPGPEWYNNAPAPRFFLHVCQLRP